MAWYWVTLIGVGIAIGTIILGYLIGMLIAIAYDFWLHQ